MKLNLCGERCGETAISRLRRVRIPASPPFKKLSAFGDKRKGWSEKGGQKRWSELTKKQSAVMQIIKENPSISRKALASQLGINESAVQKHTEHLKKKEAIRRIGPAKGGH